MPRCPFCKGQIGENLLRFGGHCPHCLNEIPGEETATDPGAEARARAEAEARAAAARVQRRNRILSAVLLALVVSISGAWLALHETPKPLVLDDTEVYIAPASAHENAQFEAMAAAEAEKAKATQRRNTNHRSSQTTQSDPASENPGEALASTAGPETAEPAAPVPTLRPDGTINPDALNKSLLGPDIRGPSAKGLSGLELSSDDDIKNMVRSFLKTTGKKQLTQCYEARLKQNPGLSGRWNAIFVIEKEGMVKSASAEGLNVKDHDLELCLVQKMETWKFQAINHSVEMQTPLVFQGSG